MLNQKEKRELKKTATERIEEIFSMDGFEVAGQTKEGVAVQVVDGEDYFVIKVIVKDPAKNPIEDALEEKAEYDEEVAKKEEEKAKKKKEREEKKKED